MSSFCDFNDADDQVVFSLIPKGTISKVRLKIVRGGYSDPSLGLANDIAKKSKTTGSIYLFCEYTVLEGDYKNRKIYSMIGIKSQRGAAWGEQGRSLIKAILNSAHGFKSSDNSEEARKARKLNDLSELDGIEFIARIDIEKDQNGESRNIIKSAITPDSHYYYNDESVAIPVHGDGVPIGNSGFDDEIPF